MSELPREDEARAIAAAKAEPRLFDVLYEAHFQRIFRYLLARTRDPAQAEDLTQQTFLNALQSIGKYRDTGAPYSAYLYRIAHNLLINWHRQPNLENMEQAEIIPDTKKTSYEDALIWNEIKKLPVETQDALALRFREGLTIPQIASALKKSESATKMMISRALALVRAKLV